MNYRVGTAGWSLPKQHLDLFPAATTHEPQSHLERYAGTLHCVEINSSFYRSHRPGTWARWATTTPDDFRFAVKMPKAITHEARLVNCGAALQRFFAEISGLHDKLGPILVQLPPKLTFDEAMAHEFLTTLRELHSGSVALEPRNSSWFTAPANRLLCDFRITRVAADPSQGSALAATPGGWTGLRYWRLHGAPRTYYSDYDESWQHTFIEHLIASALPMQTTETWVIFDNTALGHATANAVRLAAALARGT